MYFLSGSKYLGVSFLPRQNNKGPITVNVETATRFLEKFPTVVLAKRVALTMPPAMLGWWGKVVEGEECVCRRRRRRRRLGVVETEDETGGTPKETMRRTILAFAFVLHALLLGLLLRIGTFGFFFSTKH